MVQRRRFKQFRKVIQHLNYFYTLYTQVSKNVNHIQNSVVIY